MDSEPGREGDSAVEFVAMLADFGHRRVTSNHRHDAFIKILKRVSWLPCNVQKDGFRATLARLFRHRCKLGQRLAIFARDIGEVPENVNTRKTSHRKVRLSINATARPRLDPQVA